MASLNNMQIIGSLGRDPEIKFLPNGSSVANFSLATDEGYKDKNTGAKIEKTEWHQLTAYGKLAELIGQYLKKGSSAYFQGKLKTDEYMKDGVKRYSTKIVVDSMQMLDRRDTSAPGNNPSQPAQQPQRELGQSLTRAGTENEMGYWYGDYRECHDVIIQRLRNAGIAMWPCGAQVPANAWNVEGFR